MNASDLYWYACGFCQATGLWWLVLIYLSVRKRKSQ
jgi:hypothetical protein